jgi:hypothetical protein
MNRKVVMILWMASGLALLGSCATNKVYKQMRLEYNHSDRLVDPSPGKLFKLRLAEATDPFDYLMKGKPYIPRHPKARDTALIIGNWQLAQDYKEFLIHSLTIELEDGRTIELMDQGVLRYQLPPLTQIKHFRWPISKLSYENSSEELYVFEGANYDGSWTHTIAIFPRVREEIIGLNIQEAQAIRRDIKIRLGIEYSFDDEVEHHKENFLIHGLITHDKDWPKYPRP